jgi:5-dehydro-2-deoxygluconokinase
MATILNQKSKFLVLGRAGMDLYADPPGTKVEVATKFATALGGSSGNIAAGLARHGLSTSLLTCVSDDAVGRFVRNELEKYGIDARYVRVLADESRTSLAVTETRIENTQNTIYRNNASDLLLSDEQVAEVPFDEFDALIVTGTALAANPSRSATLRAMERARDVGALVIIDLDYRPYSWPSSHEAAETYRAAIEASDMVIGNDDEFAVVANGSHEDGRNLAADMGQGDTTIVYKMGEKGSVVFAKDGSFETGIFRVEAIKPMGAGDAFMASLMAGLAAEKPMREAVLQGAAAAAMVVSRIGCAPAMPTPADLDQFLKNNTAPQT